MGQRFQWWDFLLVISHSTRRHPRRRWTDAPVPQRSVQNNPASVSSLSASTNTLISSLLQESELTELKDTIDILKAKNTEAQEIIQGALSNPEITPKGPECALNLSYDSACWPLHTTVSVLSFPRVFRNADQSPELLREYLQPHQHHQPLQYG